MQAANLLCHVEDIGVEFTFVGQMNEMRFWYAMCLVVLQKSSSACKWFCSDAEAVHVGS